MYTYPTAPQTVGGVLDRGYLLFKETFSRCWPLALLQSIASAGANVYQVMEGMPGSTDPLAMFRSPSFWGVAFVGGLLAVGFYIALTLRILDVAMGRSGTMADAVGAGFRKLPRVFVASILFGLAMLIGFILLIIPGVYLSVALIMYATAIVVDDQGITESLRTSRALVKGNFWRTSAVVSVVAAVLFIAAIVVGLIAGIVAGSAAAMLFGDPRASLLVVQAVSIAINVFASPLMAAVMLELYFDLKLRREVRPAEATLPA